MGGKYGHLTEKENTRQKLLNNFAYDENGNENSLVSFTPIKLIKKIYTFDNIISAVGNENSLTFLKGLRKE